jgi:hypothetical protein
MANHEVPRTAKRIERIHGIDADGNVVTVSVYQHTRQGHSRPMFYVVQYREHDRRIVRASRWTNQFSGPDARARLEADLAESRDALADSRVRAAHALAA